MERYLLIRILLVMITATALVLLPITSVGEEAVLPDTEDIVDDGEHTHDDKPGRRNRRRLRELPRFKRPIVSKPRQ
jgi:hypothetical protein